MIKKIIIIVAILATAGGGIFILNSKPEPESLALGGGMEELTEEEIAQELWEHCLTHLDATEKDNKELQQNSAKRELELQHIKAGEELDYISSNLVDVEAIRKSGVCPFDDPSDLHDYIEEETKQDYIKAEFKMDYEE